jgi:hypothetical protein
MRVDERERGREGGSQRERDEQERKEEKN